MVNGFDNNDRGQMIMACGTGKTLASIKIAESMIGIGGLVLYAVPSNITNAPGHTALGQSRGAFHTATLGFAPIQTSAMARAPTYQ